MEPEPVDYEHSVMEMDPVDLRNRKHINIYD
jgi:hypothetical protein